MHVAGIGARDAAGRSSCSYSGTLSLREKRSGARLESTSPSAGVFQGPFVRTTAPLSGCYLANPVILIRAWLGFI